jgi:hypothetical protein
MEQLNLEKPQALDNNAINFLLLSVQLHPLTQLRIG